MSHFTAVSQFSHSRDAVFRYHENPGAIDRLIPPWENVRIAQRSDSLEVGSEVELVQSIFGIRKSWLARHTELDPGHHFTDVMVHGPFARWIHRHEFESVGEDACELSDRIEYQLPLAPFSAIADAWVRTKLNAMFAFRHRITADDLRSEQNLRNHTANLGRTPRIAITGSSGLIGRRVADLASVWGWHVIRILRPASRVDATPFPRTVESVVWDLSGVSPPSALSDLDAVIHLAGHGIAEERWSDAVKKKIWSSRVDGTRALVDGLRALPVPPKRMVCASGIGIFGDAGDRPCTEESPAGQGFLSDLAIAWESAAQEFSTSAHSVVQARLGVVLHPRAGALAKMLTPARLGLGGPIGSGRQYWPWVHVDDAANILLHLAMIPDASGPYHVVAPQTVTQREFAKTLGKVLHRPSFMPVPEMGLRLLMGEMAGPLLLASVRAETPKLLASGYTFRFPELQGAFKNLLGAH
ncbi:MAG: TIGR01777 family oxidoreductase [Pirellula sp.]|nr:TIGR01777 family oxidoreductase [Pirellula sp.]